MLSQSERRKLWAQIIAKTGGRCYYCGRSGGGRTPKMGQAPVFMTIDHIVPASRGGADDIDNLVPACRACNCAKCAGSVEELRHSAAQRVAKMPGFTYEQIEWMRRHDANLKQYDNFRFWFEKENSRRLWQASPYQPI